MSVSSHSSEAKRREYEENSPWDSAAKIWSKNTWLSEKHISKYIQSIARVLVWELPLQRWVFLSVVNFEQSPSSWKKEHKCRRSPQSWAPARQPGISERFPLDAKLTDIHKLFPIFWPVLNCIHQDCPIHLGSKGGDIWGADDDNCPVKTGTFWRGSPIFFSSSPSTSSSS